MTGAKRSAIRFSDRNARVGRVVLDQEDGRHDATEPNGHDRTSATLRPVAPLATDPHMDESRERPESPPRACTGRSLGAGFSCHDGGARRRRVRRRSTPARHSTTDRAPRTRGGPAARQGIDDPQHAAGGVEEGAADRGAAARWRGRRRSASIQSASSARRSGVPSSPTSRASGVPRAVAARDSSRPSAVRRAAGGPVRRSMRRRPIAAMVAPAGRARVTRVAAPDDARTPPARRARLRRRPVSRPSGASDGTVRGALLRWTAMGLGPLSPSYSSGHDFAVEIEGVRFRFSAEDFSSRVGAAAVRLGLIGRDALGPAETEDLVALTAHGRVARPSQPARGPHRRPPGALLGGGADLVHWLRRLVFRGAWIDQQVARRRARARVRRGPRASATAARRPGEPAADEPPLPDWCGDRLPADAPHDGAEPAGGAGGRPPARGRPGAIRARAPRARARPGGPAHRHRGRRRPRAPGARGGHGAPRRSDRGELALDPRPDRRARRRRWPGPAPASPRRPSASLRDARVELHLGAPATNGANGT